MVIFNELVITADKNNLIIDCQVENLNIYKDMYIKSVHLEYYKNSVTPGVPSEKAIQIYDGTVKKDKAIRKCVSIDDLALYPEFGTGVFNRGLFYVIVICDGDLPPVSSEFACGFDNTVDIGVVLDWHFVYEKGMQFISMMNSRCIDDCLDKTGFSDFLMLWNMIKFSMEGCDYTQLAKSWEKFLRLFSKSKGSISVSSGCGCK